MFKPEKDFDPIKAEEVRKRLEEWLIPFLIVNYGFVHQVLMMLNKVSDDSIDTAGVRVLDTSKFELRYNPGFIYNMTDSERVFVLYHEVLHLVLHHCTRRKFDDHQRGNVACDLAVNDLIEERPNSCSIPRDEKGGVVGWHVKELIKQKDFSDILHKQSAEWYYDYLEKKEKEGKIQRIPGLGCGQGSGEPKEDDKGSGEPKGSGEGEMKGLNGSDMDKHDDWKENERADEKVKQKVKEINSSNSWGTMTSGAKELILAAQVKKINWRNKIRVFFGNMAWKDKEATRKRPNRRTGFVHPGHKRLSVDRFLVAVDTSGSVGSGLLAEFLGVLNGMLEFIPIDIMQFDCSKQTEPVPYDRHTKKFEFKGRGGTDFQVVMDVVSKSRYKGVVILTDGAAPAPTKPTNNARVLWVMPEGCNSPVDWGDKVHMARHV